MQALGGQDPRNIDDPRERLPLWLPCPRVGEVEHLDGCDVADAQVSGEDLLDAPVAAGRVEL